METTSPILELNVLLHKALELQIEAYKNEQRDIGDYYREVYQTLYRYLRIFIIHSNKHQINPVAFDPAKFDGDDLTEAVHTLAKEFLELSGGRREGEMFHYYYYAYWLFRCYQSLYQRTNRYNQEHTDALIPQHEYEFLYI